jgi:endonuclease/exonuclease/phosphatase family metal-dependent hydrolase
MSMQDIAGIARIPLLLLLPHATSPLAATPCPTPANHMRIVSWNIEHLGKRTPLRTTAQRKLVGERMLAMDAAVFLLQEIESDNAFATVVDHMNELSDDTWRSYRSDKHNALVYNASQLEVIDAPRHWLDSDYPQSSFRPPVTAAFGVVGHSISFRVIGIHAHYKDEQVRRVQAQWLSDKMQSLVEDSNETDNIILCGDYNTGGDPSDGLLHVLDSGGVASNVPKENGPGTGWAKREESDYFSATPSSAAIIRGGTCHVNEPEEFDETYVTFEETYSDHSPVVIDINMGDPER